MDFLIFALVYGPLWLLTWLPLPVLYLFSDFIAFLMWHIVPYRKKIVIKNLTLSFPEKGESEIKKLARRNIHYFCDSFIESLAALHMSEKELKKRYRFKDLDLLESIYKSDRDVTLLAMHYGNWEWISLLPTYTSYNCFAVYKTLNNKYFDKLFIRLRSRFGLIPVSRQDTLRAIIKYRHDDKRFLVYSIADQRPRGIQIQHWITFMNQDTPVVLGPEKIARKYDMAVVFYKINVVSRGHYECEFILVADDAKVTKPPEITEKYYQMMEQHITDQPAYYLWTHNRWKHKKDSNRS